ncbi:uncharacterized protein K444DRAFT_18037 [Hyaloscypha bicolor E]|uniref:Uncharacterized protein n=1 Tax=Hyaloscypha bicolor E TaxID=1095630 RepID=A0A2J6TX04_9HELO|nr:uncharacterized protein K444DRAFT_18037 [Hyaloscypha bicolor E]PMD67562.1 hypothetical protein K444DRAFT_18037 [Hyaloscypha bicolor E]
MNEVHVANVLEYDNSEFTSKKPAHTCSISYRSSSIKPSMRSSRSRITLVGYDEDLEYKLDTAYGTTDKVKESTWLDHFLGVFCIRRRGRVSLRMTVMPTKPEEDEYHCRSPYILPVHVLSTQKDKSRHFIPKEAKCTIDTGNLQGNLVSKTFVIDVLGYPESCFQPLTKVEEAGGTGVTGHKLIPQGAISLTWYHNNSTRVFRDMRFLISEHPMYDLIIGSQSIHQNRILDVPNLMDGEHNVPNKEKGSEKLEELRDIMNERKTEYAPIQKKVEGPKKSKDPKILEQYHSLKQKYEIAVQNFNAENRRFQIDRYWNKHKEVKGRNEKLEELRNEWQKDFPGEEIPARVLTNPKATKGD